MMKGLRKKAQGNQYLLVEEWVCDVTALQKPDVPTIRVGLACSVCKRRLRNPTSERINLSREASPKKTICVFWPEGMLPLCSMLGYPASGQKTNCDRKKEKHLQLVRVKVLKLIKQSQDSGHMSKRPLMSQNGHQGSAAPKIIAVMVPQTLKGHSVLPFNKFHSEKRKWASKTGM